MNTQPRTCTSCGNELDPEERVSPYLDDNGDVMCDDCYREHCQGRCERCGDVVPKDELEASIGRLIACWHPADGSPDDLQRGYYRVKNWPIYTSWMIGASMNSYNLERIGDLIESDAKRASNIGYDCSPLCETCRKEIETALQTQKDAA